MARSPASPTDSISSPTPLTVWQAAAVSEMAATPKARSSLRTMVVVLCVSTVWSAVRTGGKGLGSLGAGHVALVGTGQSVFAPGNDETRRHDQGNAQPGGRGRQHSEQQPAIQRRPKQPGIVHHDHARDFAEAQRGGEKELPERS